MAFFSLTDDDAGAIAHKVYMHMRYDDNIDNAPFSIHMRGIL